MSYSGYQYPPGYPNPHTMVNQHPPLPPPQPMGIPPPMGHAPPLPLTNMGIPPPPLSMQPPMHHQFPPLSSSFVRHPAYQGNQPPPPMPSASPAPLHPMPPPMQHDLSFAQARFAQPPPAEADLFSTQGIRFTPGTNSVTPGIVTPAAVSPQPTLPQSSAVPGQLGSAASLPSFVVPQQIPVVIPILADGAFTTSDLSQQPVPTDLEQVGVIVAGPGARPELAAAMALANVKLSKDDKEGIAKSKKYAMEQSIKMVLMKQTLAHQQLQARSLQRHQALVLMCRVYIGSIAFDLKEDTIRNSFAPFGPIKAINMSWDPVTQKHKGFAFVEYELPEAAQLSLEQMNGAVMAGRNIKVGRPSNMPQAQSIIDEINEESKSFNRIYIASVHPDLTEDDIKGVFEAFGKIVSCRLAPAPGSGNKHRGFGFIEYETTQAAHDAIASMNLFDLGGQYLRVGRAIVPPSGGSIAPPSGQALPTATALAAAAATASVQAAEAVQTVVAPPVQSVAPIILSPAIIAATAGLPSTPPAIFSMPPPGIVIPAQVPASVGGGIQPVAVVIPSLATPPPGIISPPAMAASIPPPVVMAPTTTGAKSVNQPISAPPVVPPPSVEDRKRKYQEEQEARHQEDLKKKLVQDSEPITLEQQENLSVRGSSARHLVMQRLMRKQESRVVLMRNMVGPEDVDELLQEEINEECSKYGVVQNVIIYQERQSEEEDAEVLVKIFVEFSRHAEAEAAKSALNGRFFGGRTVRADIYDQSLYEQHELSG